MYKLFVLDYDGTYDNEDEGGYGVEPSAYLIKIPENDLSIEFINTMELIRNLADRVSYEFHISESDDCIGDIFESLLKENEIEFQNVGSLHIPFDERQIDYLADDIERFIV